MMMLHLLLLPLFFALAAATATVVGREGGDRKPLYKYRYESEDVMKTAASTVPVRGYHVVEGGYYPTSAVGYGGYIPPPVYGNRFIGAGYGGGGPFGYESGYRFGPIGAGGFAPALGLRGAALSPGGGPFIGAPIYQHHQHGLGGEFVDKNIYSGAKKNLNDESFEKAQGQRNEEQDRGQEGYSKGVAAVKNDKAENEYYNDQRGDKKVVEDGRTYNGAQHFDHAGKDAGNVEQQSGHKKGHVIKGYKTSHHKDESGKTEEYYDEENDEGDKFDYHGQSGSFGGNGASSYKGGHENGNFAAGGHKTEGHSNREHFLDNSNADQGKYGERKYSGSGAVYGLNNGVDQQSLLGHQESTGIYKHHPHHVPFY